MKRKLKNIITATIFIASIMGAFLLGKSQAKILIETKTVTETVEVIPRNYINTQSCEFINNYIDMREVTDFSATETGLQLYLSNGNGYYLER